MADSSARPASEIHAQSVDWHLRTRVASRVYALNFLLFASYSLIRAVLPFALPSPETQSAWTTSACCLALRSLKLSSWSHCLSGEGPWVCRYLRARSTGYSLREDETVPCVSGRLWTFRRLSSSENWTGWMSTCLALPAVWSAVSGSLEPHSLPHDGSSAKSRWLTVRSSLRSLSACSDYQLWTDCDLCPGKALRSHEGSICAQWGPSWQTCLACPQKSLILTLLKNKLNAALLTKID